MVSRLCGQVSEAVKITEGFGSKNTMKCFGLGVECSSGNGDEGDKSKEAFDGSCIIN